MLEKIMSFNYKICFKNAARAQKKTCSHNEKFFTPPFLALSLSLKNIDSLDRKLLPLLCYLQNFDLDT